MTTIRIVHSRAEGTLIEGSRKGDGVWEIVRTRGFRSSRTVGLYVPHSRDKAVKTWIINNAAGALRAAGFTVEVSIDDETPGRSFAEAETDRNTWSEDRADRYGERANRNTASGNARWERTRERMRHRPPGQPTLVGHHSERADRNLLDWAHRQEGKAIEEVNTGKYWAGRAAAAEHYRQHREDPGRTRRRIDKLEADRRRLVRQSQEKPTKLVGEGQEPPDGAVVLQTYDDGSRWCQMPISAKTKARYEADIAALDDELGYWREILAKAAERGVKLWSRDDFKEKDVFVITRWGTAVEVMRANPKSVTIPWSHYWITGGPGAWSVADCEQAKRDGGRLHTDTVPYNEVRGKVTRAELEGLDPGQVRELIARKVREARGDAVDE
ncbi:DUF3560 domain-containing protein [Streptosporangium sp. NPDC000563]|uniref:DUF3560 domain-containing protein n=1 Tax=Streptosporangium sp. NPDC000563 TaxID=3154366 RepID=UPI003321181F